MIRVQNANRLNIELVKTSKRINQGLRKKLGFSFESDKVFSQAFTNVSVTTKITSHYLDPTSIFTALAEISKYLPSIPFVNKAIQRFSVPKYDLLPGLIHNFARNQKTELISLANEYVFTNLEDPDS